ncbi:ATP-binding protein [Streptomyces sp. NPDC004546]|uniref:ATP-binding protein n=1 Tax=unclassified Streptomyces TaxID=2593676 RepID=UPI0033ACD75D
MVSTDIHPAHTPGQTALAAHTSNQLGPPRTGSTRTAVVALPAEPASVAAARLWATGVLTLWGLSTDDRGTAELVISELAGNAVLYGHSEMAIRLAQHKDQLRMCVTDSGARSAQQLAVPQELDEHGRGLAIVQALAESIEVTREPGGWRVGAVLHVSTTGTRRRHRL